MKIPIPARDESQEPGEAVASVEHVGLLTRVLAVCQMMWGNKWLKLSCRLGCTLLLFAFLLHSVSWPTIGVKLHKLDAGLFAVGIIVGLFGVVISAYQWQFLLDAEHIRMDLRKLINLYFVGIAFNHFLPTGMGGDVVKVYYVGRKSQNTPAAASAVVMSRFTGFLGMMLVSLPAVLIWRAEFKPALTTSFLLLCLAVFVALGGVFLMVTALPSVTHRWLRGKTRVSVMKIGMTIRKSMLRPHAMGKAVLFGVGFHMGAALNCYCYARALSVSSVPVTFFLVAVPFVSLISFLPISINGFGVRESAFVYIFSQMNMYHHPSAEVSLVLILLMDFQVLLYGLVGGCIYLAMGMHREKRLPASVKSGSEVNVSPQELSI